MVFLSICDGIRRKFRYNREEVYVLERRREPKGIAASHSMIDFISRNSR